MGHGNADDLLKLTETLNNENESDSHENSPFNNTSKKNH